MLLAETLIAQGEVEETAVIARQVLEGTRGLGSYIVAQRLEGVGVLLRPYQDSPAVAALLLELQETGRRHRWLEELRRLEASEAAS